MSHQRMMRRSYRGVIAQLDNNLTAKLTKDQKEHFQYLRARAVYSERKRQAVRRHHRHIVTTSRRANR